MDDKIIGIEVAGLTYGLKDEAATSEAEQAKRKADTAEEAAEAAISAVEGQAEKIAEIESNISDIKFKGLQTPLFELNLVKAKGGAAYPTISIPVSVAGSGVFTPLSGNVTNYTFSLQFFSDCVAVTYINVYRNGPIPAEWSSLGYVSFGILYSYIKSLLKEKYPDRTEEIDNYVDKVLTKFKVSSYLGDKQNLVSHGEPGAVCISTQQVRAGGSNSDYFMFIYTCDYIVKVLSQGSYSDSTNAYSTFAVIRAING